MPTWEIPAEPEGVTEVVDDFDTTWTRTEDGEWTDGGYCLKWPQLLAGFGPIYTEDER